MNNQKSNTLFAIIFLALSFVLFIFASVITFPKEEAQSVNTTQPQISSGYWTIEEDSYEVLNEFGIYHSADSTFMTPKEYYYFNVRVEQSNGDSFVMAVRTYSKTELLREGQTPELYGMISEYPHSDIEFTADNSDAEYNICLNDNDETPMGNLKLSITFFCAAALCVLFALKVLNRNRNLK